MTTQTQITALDDPFLALLDELRDEIDGASTELALIATLHKVDTTPIENHLQRIDLITDQLAGKHTPNDSLPIWYHAFAFLVMALRDASPDDIEHDYHKADGYIDCLVRTGTIDNFAATVFNSLIENARDYAYGYTQYFKQGFYAHLNKQPITDNPYLFETPRYNEWNYGWQNSASIPF